MKTLFFSMTALTLVGASLLLSGCGGGGTVSSTSKLVQSWTIQKLSETTCPGTLDVSDSVTVACGDPASDFFTMKADGTVTGSSVGHAYTGTWSLSGDQLHTHTNIVGVGTEDDTSTVVSVSDTELVLRDSDGVVSTCTHASN